MGERVQTKHTKEFKIEAVMLAEELGNVAEAARRLGVCDKNLYTWKKLFAKDGAAAFPGKGRLTPDDDRLRKLERENRELKMENEILKKASTYFAKQMK